MSITMMFAGKGRCANFGDCVQPPDDWILITILAVCAGLVLAAAVAAFLVTRR
jgi:hypothetical protein